MFSRTALLTRLFAALALVMTAVLAASTTPSGASGATGSQVGQARQAYIVVLDDAALSSRAQAVQHSQQFGARVRGVYTSALRGYAADLTTREVARLRADPRVDYVVADEIYTINQTPQTVPTGVRRIFADDNPNLDIDGADDVRIDADVAVLDTGVLAHSDLDVVARANCVTGSCATGTGNDDNGHGTHVAGTVAALDNGIGVVGVAPGARIHSVKVCTGGGRCPSSAIVAGIDYITARASTIEVTNVSLGGPGTNSAQARAITNSVNAGVVYAVAAGNDDQNAAGFSPANHPDVITVSALADFNGAPGGGGGPTCRSDQDDTLANFSNFGSTVEVAAPGVCILSTWNDGGYNTISGTSMATPHVAGAAAILTSGPRDPTNRTEALAIRQQIVSSGNFDWTDDSGDGIQEPLLDVHDPNLFPPGGGGGNPPVTVYSDDFEAASGWTADPAGTDTATAGQWVRGNPAATSFGGTGLQLGTTTSGTNDLVTGAAAGSGTGSFDVDGGVTSIMSPQIALPATGTLSLSAQWYLAHLTNASGADFFRIGVVSSSGTTTVFQQLGAATNRPGGWGAATANLTGFAGQTVRLLVQAADAGSPSLVEAGVDDVRITQQT